MPATNAPLAATLELTTDVPSRLSVSIEDGLQSWQRNFYDFSTVHALPLLGFKPGRTNRITVTAYDRQRNQTSTTEPLVFVTPKLPPDFPILTLLQSAPERMEPGYTLFRVAIHSNAKGYQTIVDNSGEVVWYSPIASQLDVRQLDNGDLFLFTTRDFLEVNMLGETVNSWEVPANLPINTHDGVPTSHGTILYLSDASTVVSNYPTSTVNPSAPLQTATNLVYQRVVEISTTNGAVLNIWPLIQMLDPRRITYMTTLGATADSEHANALIEDPSDNSIIVSLRHQNAIIKFSRATGKLRWILGPHENWGPAWQPYLLAPVGEPFEWQYGQHALVLTPQKTLLLYDNGDFRATPFDPAVPDATNYSRAVEYAIDETNMTVSQVWDFGRGTTPRFYTDRVGNADLLTQTGNILVDFGSIRYTNGFAPSRFGPNATMARIQEVTHDAVPEVLFDLAVSEFDNTNVTFRDCYAYRSHRIPDLYSHPATPVADLTVNYQGGVTHLEFSADPTRTYTVEASADLEGWESIGVASEQTVNGEYQFDEPAADSIRYYRVVTQ